MSELKPLLPCPFCGGEALLQESPRSGCGTWFEPTCQDCGVAVSHTGKADAIAAWNTRTKGQDSE